MKRQYKQNITFNLILSLCVCCVVWGDPPPLGLTGKPTWNDEAPIVEEVVLKTIAAYSEAYTACCIDTFTIKDIYLRVGRRDFMIDPVGHGGAPRTRKILLPDTDDDLRFVSYFTSPPEIRLLWRKGDNFYPTVVDGTSLEELKNTIISFEKGPYSCSSDCYHYLNIKIDEL
ncbi:MAG: hypothetical protein LBC84_02365 [Prevotellaceae bacterium]|nr:hypothetical protein [Prevotellaceae bacterium]